MGTEQDGPLRISISKTLVAQACCHVAKRAKNNYVNKQYHLCIINLLCFSLPVENKPHEPTGKYAFDLENGAVTKIM
jgi:hypothetical protein